MHIEKLSLYIVTMNEEKRLQQVLDSVRGVADEIVVVDSGSTDRTEEIARAHGARFLHHEWESIGHQVKWAEEQCMHDWVMRLDADEVVSRELADEIMEVRRSGTQDGYFFKVGEMYPGRHAPHPWVKHYLKLNLYDRRVYVMSGRIGHDDVVKLRDDATSGRLKHFVHHYSYDSLRQQIAKNNRATDRQVDRALAEGKVYSPWRIFGALSLNFFKYYVLGRFFLLGWWGFIHCINLGYARFLKFAKYYERVCQDELKSAER